MKKALAARLIAAGTVAGLALTGCAAGDEGSMTIEQGVYTSNLPLDLPMIVAKDRGMFSDRGLTVNTTTIESGTDMVTAIISGSVNVGNPATPPAVRVFTEKGADLGGMAGGTALDFRIVTPPGVALPAENASMQERAEMLKGKTVMVIGSGTLTDWWLRDVLQRSNMTDDDLTIIPATNVPSQIASLKSGDVDAIVAFGTVPALLGEEGTDYQVLLGIPEGHTGDTYEPYLQTFIAASTRWQDSNSEAIDAYCEAVAEAVDWLEDDANHDEAVQAMADWTQLDLPDAEKLLQTTQYRMHLDETSWTALGITVGHPDEMNVDEQVNASCNSKFSE